MAFADGSKLYAVKIVNDKKVLYEVTKDDVRKAPHVDSLPEASGSKRGLIYLYDDGDGEKAYICVNSGEDEYEWISMAGGGESEDYLTKEVYDKFGYVAAAGGINVYDSTNYVAQYGGITAYVSSSISSIPQSDWNATNSSSHAYIKNKPFGKVEHSTVAFNESFTSSGYTETVELNGTTYYVHMGDSYSLTHILTTGDRYSIVQNSSVMYYAEAQSKSITIKIGSQTKTESVRLLLVNGIYLFFERYMQIVPDDTAIWAYVPYIGVVNKSSSSVQLTITDIGTVTKVSNEYIPTADSVVLGKENPPTSGAVREAIDNVRQLPATTSSNAGAYLTVDNSGSWVIGTTPVSTGTITLGTTWSGSDPYGQIITVSGTTVTKNSKVDIQMEGAAFAQFTTDGVKYLYITNNNGVLYAFMSGGPLTDSVTVNCTVTLVDNTAQTVLYSNPIIL